MGRGPHFRKGVCFLFRGDGRGIAFRIEQHDFDSRKAPLDGLAQFLGIKVGQAAIEKEYLPRAALQLHEGFGASAGLCHAADWRTQTFENALAHHVAGAGHQDAVGIVGRNRVTRHTFDLKPTRLETD